MTKVKFLKDSFYKIITSKGCLSLILRSSCVNTLCLIYWKQSLRILGQSYILVICKNTSNVWSLEVNKPRKQVISLWARTCSTSAIKIQGHAGPMLESKGMCAICQKKGKKRAKNVKQGKKRTKYLKNLDKNVQNLKMFWKRASDCVR